MWLDLVLKELQLVVDFGRRFNQIGNRSFAERRLI